MKVNRKNLRKMSEKKMIFEVLEDVNHIGLNKGEVFSVEKVGRFSIEDDNIKDNLGFLNGIKILKEGGETDIIYDIGFEDLLLKKVIH